MKAAFRSTRYAVLLNHYGGRLTSLSKTQCIENLGAVLKAAGSSWEQVVKVNVYLKNMDDFAAMNQVYEKRECHFHPPIDVSEFCSLKSSRTPSHRGPASRLRGFQTTLMSRSRRLRRADRSKVPKKCKVYVAKYDKITIWFALHRPQYYLGISTLYRKPWQELWQRQRRARAQPVKH